jgi:hypothetical protein
MRAEALAEIDRAKSAFLGRAAQEQQNIAGF